MSCSVGRRCGSDMALMCLWRRPAATALIHPLAWEPPYAAGVALKDKRKKIFDLGKSGLDISSSIPKLYRKVLKNGR